MINRIRRVAVGGALLALLAVPSTASAGEPTCSGYLAHGSGEGLVNHGQHVVSMYVLGYGPTEFLAWTPSGGAIGAAIAGGGAAMPGGPGPAFHFGAGVAPGASFCVDQARSFGVHLDPLP